MTSPLAQLAGVVLLGGSQRLHPGRGIVQQPTPDIPDLTLQRLGQLLTPPDDLRPIHALLGSAVKLASTACAQRIDAVRTGEMQTAWAASSMKDSSANTLGWAPVARNAESRIG